MNELSVMMLEGLAVPVIDLELDETGDGGVDQFGDEGFGEDEVEDSFDLLVEYVVPVAVEDEGEENIEVVGDELCVWLYGVE